MIRRAALILCGVALASVLLLPPWRITWTTGDATPPPLALPSDWAGFHPWSYASARPDRVIAWDGASTGGKVTFTGTPAIAAVPWALLLGMISLGAYLLARRR